jgi:hypothetical protein
VLHNQVARIDNMTMCITSWEGTLDLCRVAASSNTPVYEKTAQKTVHERLLLLCAGIRAA